MEMHEIKYFLAACRTLNFHRAAELSHVSQPALTRAVQKLEAELGGHLFHREHNQIRVTDFGRLMRSHLEQVLRQTDTAKVAAQGFLKLEAASAAIFAVMHSGVRVQRCGNVRPLSLRTGLH